ncbi:MAG: signal peptide peptidase SppA [Bacteroidales bacterium]|nr:signal peptide peptidase SppA [Bacteroidales bacterium]
MKDFLKMLAAAVLGCSLVLFSALFLAIGMLSLMISTSSAGANEVPHNAILKISFERPILEQSSMNPISKFIPFGLWNDDGYGYYQLVSAIDRAVDDSRIQMIYLNTNYLSAGIAQIEELREALKRFRSSGKAVVAYSDSYTQAGYYLASVADKVYLNPQGQVELRGFAVSSRYYKGLMDELGVQAQVIRHGSYKSGGESFTESRMSEREREQLGAFLQSAWNHWAKGMAEARQIGIETINQVAERMGCSHMMEAKELQIIDEAYYKDQFIDRLCLLQGVKHERQLRVVDMSVYMTGKSAVRTRDKIAVLFAGGTLYMGKGQQDIMSENYIQTIRKLRADSTVKAVVLRVDSPGGDAAAAAVIHRELQLLKEVKPLIVSIGDDAASGGYWIACAGDYIFGAPASFTGSIGAYAMTYNGQKALDKWLKVNVETIRTHSSSDAGSLYRPLNTVELSRIQQNIDRVYVQFVTTVSLGRGLLYEEADALAQGRIWSGTDAVKNGLIDQIGGLNDAINYAAKSVGLIQYQVVEYPSTGTFLERVRQSTSAMSAGGIPSLSPDPQKWAREIESAIYQASERGVQAKVPFLYQISY